MILSRATERLLCLLGLACALTLSALAADEWRPPPPTGNDGFDWIQLKSGEWLRGRLKYIQNRKVEFVSDELGRLPED